MIIYTHTMLLLLPPVDGADRQKECMEMSAENGKRWESFLFFEPFGERWPNQKDRRGGNSIRTHYTYHGARKPRRDFLATHTHTPFISLGMSTAVKQRCHDLYIYKSRGVRTRIILPSERYKRGVSPTGENGQGVLFSVATSSCSPTQHQTARCLIKNYTFGWRAVGRVNTYIPCESFCFVLFLSPFFTFCLFSVKTRETIRSNRFFWLPLILLTCSARLSARPHQLWISYLSASLNIVMIGSPTQFLAQKLCVFLQKIFYEL